MSNNKATVYCGKYHTLCLDFNSIVWIMGKYATKEEIFYYSIPKQIENIPLISQISCGSRHSILLDYDGNVWGFGLNSSGQVGQTNKQYVYLSKIQGLSDIISIHCGLENTFCIDSNKNIWAFGNNREGNLGLGNEENTHIPTQIKYFIDNNIEINHISSSNHTICMDNNNNFYGFGKNSSGQLSLSEKKKIFTSPVLLTNIPKDTIKVCCGENHSVFLNNCGDVFACGLNYNGQLGIPSKKKLISSDLLKINVPSDIQQITCGLRRTQCLDFEGNLYMCGDGCFEIEKVPISGIKIVSNGGNHILIKDCNGKIWARGNNEEGQLGLGDNITTRTFMQNENEFFDIIAAPITRKKSARK